MAGLNLPLLKEQLSKEKLEDFLRADFSDLCTKTKSIVKFATFLFEKEGISSEEMDKCLEEPEEFIQNCILYRAVIKRNAGGALIESLENSNNIQILHLLKNKLQPVKKESELPMNFNTHTLNSKSPFAASKTQVGQPQLGTKSASPNPIIPIIRGPPKAVTIITCGSGKNLRRRSGKPKSRRPHIDILRRKNWAELGESESGFENVLLRLAATVGSGEKASRVVQNSTDFHPDSSWAILKFLHSHLDAAVKNGEKGKGNVLDIYIDSEFLDTNQWKILMDLLWRHTCRNTLENLWLENANESYFYEGGLQMNDKLVALKFKNAFPLLQSFIWSSTTDWSFTDKDLNKILFFKHPEVLLSSPEMEKCSFQILDHVDSGCGFMFKVNPKGVTFFYNWGSEIFKGLVDDCTTVRLANHIQNLNQNQARNQDSAENSNSNPNTNALVNTSAIQHLYFSGPSKLNITAISGEHLTRLFVFAVEGNNSGLCTELWEELDKFRSLEKLEVYSFWDWTADLAQLAGLKKLSFLFLGKAQVVSGGWPLEMFPWGARIETVVLNKCKFETRQPDLLSRSDTKNLTVILNKTPTQEIAGGAEDEFAALADPLHIAIFSDDLLNKFLYEFFV